MAKRHDCYKEAAMQVLMNEFDYSSMRQAARVEQISLKLEVGKQSADKNLPRNHK